MINALGRGGMIVSIGVNERTVMGMLRKKKMAAEIVRLTYRVQELEERLCPCEQHQWSVIDNDPIDMTTYYTYKCRRCGKTKRTWQILHVWDGGDGNG